MRETYSKVACHNRSVIVWALAHSSLKTLNNISISNDFRHRPLTPRIIVFLALPPAAGHEKGGAQLSCRVPPNEQQTVVLGGVGERGRVPSQVHAWANIPSSFDTDKHILYVLWSPCACRGQIMKATVLQVLASTIMYVGVLFLWTTLILQQ